MNTTTDLSINIVNNKKPKCKVSEIYCNIPHDA